MDETINRCLEKAAEIKIRSYKDGFIAACTDWGEEGQFQKLTFDFYLVAELDAEEGRISAIPCANFSNNCWHSRNGEPVDFWICNFNPALNIGQVSYFHPSDCTGIVLAPQPVFVFNIPIELSIANASNRKHRDKTLFKKIGTKREGLDYGRSQAAQNDIRRIVWEASRQSSNREATTSGHLR